MMSSNKMMNDNEKRESFGAAYKRHECHKYLTLHFTLDFLRIARFVDVCINN